MTTLVQNSLDELTKPFSVVQNEPSDVRNKFLEGVPWKDKDFPGPFLSALTDKQKDQYMNKQQNAVQNYHTIAETPLSQQASLYPSFNAGLPDCENYGANIPPMPPVASEFRGPVQKNGSMPMQEAQIRQGVYDYPYQAGSVEGFKDNSISDPCNQTGFGEIVPKFTIFPSGIDNWAPNESSTMIKCSEENNPLTDIQNRPVEQFSHNNMVPYYGSKLTQNMYGTGVPQAGDNNSCKGLTNGFADVTPWRDKLQTFTGTDEMYMHKRETGPLFSPAEQQTGWVFGTPAFRPDMDRYSNSVWKRNNESPVEKIQVGPGIGLDYTVPAQGGFQQFTRILPNNVNNYKANQLEGRVNAGKWFTNHPTSQYINGVSSDKPKLYITQARRPTMQTKFYNNAPSGGDSRVTDFTVTMNKGKQARSDTEPGAGFGQFDLHKYLYEGKDVRENFASKSFNDPSGLPCVTFGQAPVGRIMGSIVPMPSQDLQSYNNIRETFKRGSAGYSDKKGYWECLDSEQGTNRWDLFGPAKGVVSSQGPREGWYANYTDRGDVNPFVINVTGTTQTGGVWNPNSFQDQQRVTTKETTTYAYQGNAKGNVKNDINTWSDLPKVTKSETTTFAYQGNPNGKKQYENTWSDLPKVSRKETTAFAYQGNAAGKISTLSDRSMYTGGDMILGK